MRPLGECGDVAEWSKAHAWKVCIGVTLSWVRIPPSPPQIDSFASDAVNQGYAVPTGCYLYGPLPE